MFMFHCTTCSRKAILIIKLFALYSTPVFGSNYLLKSIITQSREDTSFFSLMRARKIDTVIKESVLKLKFLLKKRKNTGRIQ